jgi:hypothetical protein
VLDDLDGELLLDLWNCGLAIEAVSDRRGVETYVFVVLGILGVEVLGHRGAGHVIEGIHVE